MPIEDLITVVSPPAIPQQVGTPDDLAKLEAGLGFQLPSDYRDFALKYGTGSFLDGYLQIYNPFVVDLLATATAENSRCRYFHQSGSLPWPPLPESPGIIEIGGNENGHTLLYLTDGDHDEWPIVVVPHGDHKNFERWQLQLGTFMAQALMNKITTAAVHACNQPVQPDERMFYQPAT